MGKEFIDYELLGLAVECGNYQPRYFDTYFKAFMGGHWGCNGPFVAVSRPLTNKQQSPFSVFSQVERMDGKPIRD